jgi:hypothetical protein
MRDSNELSAEMVENLKHKTKIALDEIEKEIYAKRNYND